MVGLLPKHIFIMLLTVFLTAGFSMSAAQASIMSATMKMTADNGMAMSAVAGMHTMADLALTGDCKSCLKNPGDDGNPVHCRLTCIAPVLGVLPQGVAMTTARRLQQSSALLTTLLRGRSSLPDPFPPRLSA